MSGVPADSVLMVGQNLSLVAVAKDASGTTLTGRAITWSSSDATVASVSSGSVTGIKGGFVTISASAEGRTGAADLSIRVAVPTPAAGATQPTTTTALGGAVTLTVPPAAVAAGTVLNVAPASPAALPASSLLLANVAFTFGPDGTQFATPVTLALRYDSTKVPAVQRAGLAVYLAKNGGWEEVPGSTVSGTEVSAPVSHFSTYALLTRPPAASVVMITGNNQTGAPGSLLVVKPSVQLLDAQGRGVPFWEVKWTVASGGGTISQSPFSVTDGNGVARLEGNWTLGPTAGANTLTVVASGSNQPPPLTFTATGSASYKLVGGSVTGLGGVGNQTLIVRMNDGPPIGVAPGATSFTLPYSLALGQPYTVSVAGQPLSQTCTIVQGKGNIQIANVTSVAIQCTNNTTSPLSGTYKYLFPGGGGTGAYLTFWPDGTYSFALRQNDPGCGPSNGNGIEYGVYNWNATTGVYFILTAAVDGNGACGLSDTTGPSPVRGSGKIVKSGSALTLTTEGNTFVLSPVPSTASAIVGSFGNNNGGNDGGFVVIQNDGTYLFVETQLGTGNSVLPGFERGCYAAGVGEFTVSMASSCRPDGLSAFDSNGKAGFSDGFSVPFIIFGPNSIQLFGNGVGLNLSRILPN